IIFTRRGIHIEDYPSIKKYLNNFKEDLTPKTKNSKKEEKGRKPGQYKWYEIQDNVAYYSSFEKEKIIYSEIVPEPRFVYDDENYYIEATGFLLSSNTLNLKYLVALLNSKLLFWYFKDIGYNLGGKGFRYKKVFIEELPIKFSNSVTEKNMNLIVDEILYLNKSIVIETNNFHNFLKKELNILKISKKLENYSVLNEKDFFSELKKQKAQIVNENNIILKFKNSCEIILNLNNKINILELKLNEIIYDIYDLNKNEIKIIECND
ncbi:TaqI-like C-terminal specificity domain-containing protein, partial [Methanobrevibacter gottschalkii]|uniref:TaqI-like C-terminal specificity domain-containing protein n=1 Tax=Methanobrevibacter gottschalkii TaxID=190974 RepID=UPI0038D19664